MAEYAYKFFSLDCNGLVGNYLGLSPEVLPGGWATLSRKWVEGGVKANGEGWNGWGPAEVASLPYLPLKPRKSASEARTGDVLVSLTPGGVYEHVALVDNVSPVDKETVNWQIVEWGSETSLDSVDPANEALHYIPDDHIKDPGDQKLGNGKEKQYGVGFLGKWGRFRYLFAGPPSTFEPATWGRCGNILI
jgi:hypothetical protein